MRTPTACHRDHRRSFGVALDGPLDWPAAPLYFNQLVAPQLILVRRFRTWASLLYSQTSRLTFQLQVRSRNAQVQAEDVHAGKGVSSTSSEGIPNLGSRNTMGIGRSTLVAMPTLGMKFSQNVITPKTTARTGRESGTPGQAQWQGKGATRRRSLDRDRRAHARGRVATPRE